MKRADQVRQSRLCIQSLAPAGLQGSGVPSNLFSIVSLTPLLNPIEANRTHSPSRHIQSRLSPALL